MKNNSKFGINRYSYWLGGIVCIICFVVFVFCMAQECSFSVIADETGKNIRQILAWTALVKNIMLILFTVMASSLISVLLVEIKNKNNFYDELKQEIIDSQTFFKERKSEDNKKTLSVLEDLIFCHGDKIKLEMINFVRSKINSFDKQGYYFDKVIVSVKCNYDPMEKVFIKDVTIKKHIKSFKSQMTFKENTYVLVQTSLVKVYDSLEKIKASISFGEDNKRTLDPEKDIKTRNIPSEDDFMGVNGYSQDMVHYLSEKLELNNETAVIIVTEHTSVVPEEDTSYIFRISVPCKNFRLNYTLTGEAEKRFNLVACAFGFNDNGADDAIDHSLNEAIISFDKWIFPLDGACIEMHKKGEKS